MTSSNPAKARLFIANRGEIASRIIITCKKLKIHTIVPYSFVDRSLPFVKEADEAYPLSENDSYLDINNIVELVKKSKSTLVHPGYGFLSESAEFAQAIINANCIFLGPSPEVISLMGDKIASKKLAQSLKIPTIDGIETADDDLSNLQVKIKKIGLPIIIKASNGGGGKGMRLVTKLEDFPEALRNAKRESASFFNSDKTFIEKYIYPARHVEVQAIRDKHGNTSVIGDRDCSLQRSNQKIIEEAPAFDLDKKTRSNLHKYAKALFDKSGYTGIGTVEFLIDMDKNSYFIEVNSRIQVEHPVTEAISGIDLVEAQIRIGMGEKVSFPDLTFKKHAIEARICAETPYNNFLPSSGRLTRLNIPGERVDLGFAAGNYFSTSYDSLIAKIIITGKDRLTAIKNLRTALNDIEIAGIETNAHFLCSLLDSDTFKNGKHHIGFIKNFLEKDYVTYFTSEILIIGKFLYDIFSQEKQIFSVKCNLKKLSNIPALASYSAFGNSVAISIKSATKESLVVQCNNKKGNKNDNYEVINVSYKDNKLSYTIQNREYFVTHISSDWYKSNIGVVKIEDLSFSSSSKSGQGIKQAEETFVASLPGKIIDVKFTTGEKFNKNDTLIVLESMKMEHLVKTSASGIVKEIYVQTGSIIEKGKLLLKVRYE